MSIPAAPSGAETAVAPCAPVRIPLPSASDALRPRPDRGGAHILHAVLHATGLTPVNTAMADLLVWVAMTRAQDVGGAPVGAPVRPTS